MFNQPAISHIGQMNAVYIHMYVVLKPCSPCSGSNIENWHSIMRKGLVNASGTKLQVSQRVGILSCCQITYA